MAGSGRAGPARGAKGVRRAQPERMDRLLKPAAPLSVRVRTVSDRYKTGARRHTVPMAVAGKFRKTGRVLGRVGAIGSHGMARVKQTPAANASAVLQVDAPW